MARSTIQKSKKIRITAILQKWHYDQLYDAVRQSGIENFQLESGRTPILEERQGFSQLIFGSSHLVSDPVSIYSFLVETPCEMPMLALLAEVGELDIPGMGSLYSEEVVLVEGHRLCISHCPRLEKRAMPDNLFHKLVGVCCIVQRGQADIISRIILESGIGVPTITFGEGRGLRDKLGLLRITIPAEKEIVTVVVSAHDSPAVMELMIEAGRLNQPGRGFINTFPVRHAILNTRLTRGHSGHAASMEQIIAAIDSLKGGIEWRQRSGRRQELQHRRILQNMVDLRIVCDSGRLQPLLSAAMQSGATGATSNNARFIEIPDAALLEHDNFTDELLHPTIEHVSPAREQASLCVREEKVSAIMRSVSEAGLLDSSTHGTILFNRVPTAFTYLPPVKGAKSPPQGSLRLPV